MFVISFDPKTIILPNLIVAYTIFILGISLYACGKNLVCASILNKMLRFRMKTS